MPDTEKDVWEYLSSLPSFRGPNCIFAMIEQVGGFIGRGGRGVAVGPAMFNFGMNYGALRAFLIARRIPFETVRPQKWQKEIGIPLRKGKGVSKNKEESSTEFKNRLKAFAQQ